MTFCYWSVVDGEWTGMIRTAVRSARAVGVTTEFHVWSDGAIDGAVVHPAGGFDKSHYLFKLTFLRDAVRALDYDYFVWLDADTYFVRHPGDVLRALRGAPLHATLEANACARGNRRPDWWGCPLLMYAWLMQAKGVRSRAIYNVNAGFWIVHRDAIDTVCGLALEFWEFARSQGFTFTEEAPLAYATHMLVGDAEAHTLGQTADLWASDWTGCYADRLPDGQPWTFEDYFSGAPTTVNPAIVHAMRSKRAMVRAR